MGRRHQKVKAEYVDPKTIQRDNGQRDTSGTKLRQSLQCQNQTGSTVSKVALTSNKASRIT